MMEHEKYTQETIDGKINYGRRILSENRGKLRDQLSQKEIKRIEEISFNTMNLFGYKPEYAIRHNQIKKREKLVGYFNDSLSVLLIGNRARQYNMLSSRINELVFEIRKKSAK